MGKPGKRFLPIISALSNQGREETEKEVRATSTDSRASPHAGGRDAPRGGRDIRLIGDAHRRRRRRDIGGEGQGFLQVRQVSGKKCPHET